MNVLSIVMHMAFLRAKAGCDKWHDYEMTVAPYEKNKPIYYEFTACPAAEFAIRNGLTEIMPALCNVDFAAMELLHARLVRTTTCANGCKCDYTICGDQDPYGRSIPNTGTKTDTGGTGNVSDATACCSKPSASPSISAMCWSVSMG